MSSKWLLDGGRTVCGQAMVFTVCGVVFLQESGCKLVAAHPPYTLPWKDGQDFLFFYWNFPLWDVSVLAEVWSRSSGISVQNFLPSSILSYSSCFSLLESVYFGWATVWNIPYPLPKKKDSRKYIITSCRIISVHLVLHAHRLIRWSWIGIKLYIQFFSLNLHLLWYNIPHT